MRPKTEKLWIIQGYYDTRWEDLDAHKTRREAIANIKVYRANAPETAYRLIVRREPLGG